MGFALFCVFAFFLGSFPTAYWIGKLRGVDIREHGSGNVGATNAFRVLGRGPGGLVFLLDFLKGALPVFWFSVSPVPVFDPSAPLWVGLAAILGHVFTPFLRFKGGKGIATGAGVLLGWWPPFFFIGAGAWAVIFYFTRIVSVSSMGAAALLLLASFFLRPTPGVVVFFLLMAVFVFWTHRSNIRRLFKGEERHVNKTN